MLNGTGPPRPLLVGISAETVKDGQVVILGGGGTCFSMGTFWNTKPYSFKSIPDVLQDAEETILSGNLTLAWELWNTVNMPTSANDQRHAVKES